MLINLFWNYVIDVNGYLKKVEECEAKRTKKRGKLSFIANKLNISGKDKLRQNSSASIAEINRSVGGNSYD